LLKDFDRRSLVAHDAMICFSDETGSVIQTPPSTPVISKSGEFPQIAFSAFEMPSSSAQFSRSP
jgi:hypothetical protein